MSCVAEDDENESGGKWMRWAMNNAVVIVRKLSSCI